MRLAFVHLVCLVAAVTSQPVAGPPAIVVAGGGKAPTPTVVPQSVKLAGAEFEILTLTNYTGAVAWDVTSPDSFGVPIRILELKPKESVVGVRAGSEAPDRHAAPDTPSVVVWAVNTGTATVAAWGVKDGRPAKLATFTVLTNRGPRPPPDVDPPNPPGPKPDPKVEKSPWDNAPGLRVMVIYPKRGALPAAQQSIVTGKRVRDYLDANTAKENGEAAYWIVKTDEDVTGLGIGWQKAYATLKGDRWVVVGNGARWTAEPMPENADKMLELLSRYK